MSDRKVLVRAPREGEFDGWARLFRSYRDFYQLAPDEAVVERVWSWIHDPGHETHALAALSDGMEGSGHDDERIVGLAHYRRFARPSTGTVGIYLDDLMADTHHRGAGVGRALVAAVTAIGATDGASIVRWMTAADNITAQRLYDSVATRTTWVTYDRPCRESASG